MIDSAGNSTDAGGTDARGTDAGAARSVPLPELLLDLRDLVVRYVKQETVVPLRQVIRYLVFGIVGALLLGVGVLLLGMGSLRALQSETGDTFAGDWSWAPYGIVVVGLAVGASFTWRARRIRRVRRES